MVWFKGNANRPCRLNLTDVVLRPLNRTQDVSEEVLDEDFQQITGPYNRTPFEVKAKAQVTFEKFERLMTIFNGQSKPVVGRLVFITADLNRILKLHNLTKLENGDQITKIADLDVNYLVVEVRPTGFIGGLFNQKAQPATTTVYFGQNITEINGSRSVS